MDMITSGSATAVPKCVCVCVCVRALCAYFVVLFVVNDM